MANHLSGIVIHFSFTKEIVIGQIPLQGPIRTIPKLTNIPFSDWMILENWNYESTCWVRGHIDRQLVKHGISYLKKVTNLMY